MVLKTVYEELEDSMKVSIEKLKKNLRGLRTGRASTSLLDNIRIDYYGAITPLNQVATLTVPEHNLIVIQPWDVSVITLIEKAIHKSNLGLVPMNDGKLIRISIPPMTEERRKEVAKTVRKYCEETRISIRNIRRDGIEEVKLYEKEKEISEDASYRAQAEVQKITEKHILTVDDILKEKEKEILNF